MTPFTVSASFDKILTSVIDRFSSVGKWIEEEDRSVTDCHRGGSHYTVQCRTDITRIPPELVWIIRGGVFSPEYPGLYKHYYHKDQHPAPDEDHYCGACGVL